jgi:glucuronosyltransferase
MAWTKINFGDIFQVEFKALFILCLVTSTAYGGRILFINPNSQRSNTYLPIIRELLNRGHDVTAITSDGLYLDYENYNEIIVGGGSDNHDKLFFTSSNECHASKRSLSCVVYYLLDLLNIWSHGREVARAALNSSALQKFIDGNSEQFDVVISDFFTTEALYGFAYVKDAPLVLITSNDASFPIYEAAGVYSIWSNIDLLHGPYDRDLYFVDRFTNRLISFLLTRIRNWVHIRKSNQIAKEYFKGYQSFPSIGRIEKNAALILFNNFDLMNSRKVYLPGVLDIGGIDVFPVKPLPSKIQVIYQFPSYQQLIF